MAGRGVQSTAGGREAHIPLNFGVGHWPRAGCRKADAQFALQQNVRKGSSFDFVVVSRDAAEALKEWVFSCRSVRSRKHQAPAFGEVSFLMRDDDRAVRVDVRRELLTYLQGFSPGSREGNLVWFEKHRDRIEHIASSKYDKGDYQRYANSCVVRIGLADYLGRSGEAIACGELEVRQPLLARSPFDARARNPSTLDLISELDLISDEDAARR